MNDRSGGLSMKKADFLWVGIILAISMLFVIPETKAAFETATTAYPYLMGFIKTAILASMGELLASRIRKGTYLPNQGIIIKFFVWGFLGMIFVLAFKLFAGGVAAAQTANLLPALTQNAFWSNLLTAFLISLLMNLLFAPTFMILHRITDTYIEMGQGKPRDIVKVKLVDVIDRIDWKMFFSFIVLKTIPFFWIPAHTITFLLPENYRVLMAAYLSIALGVILSIAKYMKTVKNQSITNLNKQA